ncbi:MAG: clostripain-related cysteine peptidase, partial [Eubacterium sp.]
MKKKLIILGSILLLSFLMAGCGSGGRTTLSAANVGTKAPTGERSKWAVYWYCCGSDLESESGSATADIEEMLGASIGNDVKVVVQTGGTAKWKNDVMDASKIERYEFGSDGLKRVDQQPQANMGETETLQSFLSFCQKNYPADNTMLLFWNHGGGSVSGVSFDENHDYDSLTLKELDTAIGSVYSSEQKFDIIGMDACLMATLDNANIMKKYANYLVASEEVEPGNGWEYTKWLSALGENPGISAVDLGKAICDSFLKGCEDSGTSDKITLSVTDLSKVDSLVSAVDSMGTEALTKAAGNSKVVGQFGRSARAAENYGGNNDEEGYTNMVDLGDLMKNADNLIAATDKNVLSTLESAVVYKVNGPYRTQASGLSTYYSYDGDPHKLAEYAKVAASPNYTKFIQYSL